MADLDEPKRLAIRTIDVGGYRMRVATKPGDFPTPPLLICNGLGVRLELLEPLAWSLGRVQTILFDVPGIGGSELPAHPYRFRGLARSVQSMVTQLGFAGPIDVFGMSWGGALAQQIARTWGKRCRRLILAATCAGALMIPGSLSSVFKLLNPRQYGDRKFLERAAPEIYGGKVRSNPALLVPYATHISSLDPAGYAYQHLAMVAWTSIGWLPRLRQRTLVLAGTEDPLVHSLNARLLHRLIPDSDLHLIKDGHLFVLTSAPEVARVIDRFLVQERAKADSRATAVCAAGSVSRIPEVYSKRARRRSEG